MSVCQSCKAESTNLRRGPAGKRTLCNKCGLRWARSTNQEFARSRVTSENTNIQRCWNEMQKQQDLYDGSVRSYTENPTEKELEQIETHQHAFRVWMAFYMMVANKFQ